LGISARAISQDDGRQDGMDGLDHLEADGALLADGVNMGEFCVASGRSP
jgi:hypothetical protein